MNNLTECPPMEGDMSAPTNPGNPVTMSISLNASGKDHVADLINMMKNAGMEQAQQASAAIMPMRTDMERLRGIVDKPEMEDDAAYAEVINDDELEEYDNEPDPEYRDHKYMTKDLSGGLNREKKAYAAAQDGDNAMAVETIKASLMVALQEKKAKPDFLDVDKDGDKKEPMKKAAKDAGKDKGSKPKKGQVPPQFKKKTNESAGNIDDAIRKIFGKIYDRGDAGLDYLDNNAPFYDQLATMHGGDLDEILANISDQEKMKLGRELKSALDSMSFDLESSVSEISPDLAKRYTKAAKMDREFNDDDLERLPSMVRHGTDDQSRQAGADMARVQRRNSKRQKGINLAKKRM